LVVKEDKGVEMMVQFDVKRVQKGTESFMVSFDFTKTPVTQIADYIIIAASKHGSSDIHFDPRDNGMMVRFRIDGDCQDYTFVPKAYEKNLTTRLKLMANMNITESRLPQDGSIKGTFGDQYLDMRVSSLPLNEGEKIVIRILDYSRSLEGIDTLGFHPKNLEKIKRMMELPNGIILTTGATGSGKSTTTYSILQGLNKPETNIITVEDPIEMNIEGINQVQVNSEIGMTFAAALRSILRQDPNIILIGEIRDSETAQIAVRASITGHLVLSTIHTNSALSTVERLLDMNVERYLLSTALSGIISQRLAKMLCPECRYQRDTTKYEKKIFKKFMNMDVQKVWDANPKGCDKCRNGYKGRIALHEVLEIDEDIRIALSNENLDKKELAKMVYSGNTISMLQDALIKCLEGKTSFEEVYRNIEIENEDGDNYESEMANEIKESVPVETHAEVSNDLLETPVSKQVSNVYTPQTFSAADFNPQAQQTQVQQQVQPQTQQAQVQAQPTQVQAQIQPQTQQVQQVASVAPTPSVYPVNYQQAQVPNTQAQQQNYYYQMKLPTKHDDSKQIQAVIPELNTPQTQVQQINSNPYNGINQQQILDNSIPKLEQKI
jgi:type IV pilus assembly protein PilB